MRLTFKVIAGTTVLLTSAALLSLKQPETAAGRVKQQLIRQADDMLQLVKSMQQGGNSKAAQQRSFIGLRLAYKRLEWAAEYFDPLTARLVNGPPVPEAELNGQVIAPDGLQVIEECLHTIPKKNQQQQLTGLLSRLESNTAEFKAFFQNADLQDWQILDAAKQEVFRVEILGLNNFDDPLLKNCFDESAAALESVAHVIHLYDDRIDFSPAVLALRKPILFNCFDRAAFIIHYANPLTKSITELKKSLNLPDIRYNRLLNQDAATLFDANAFNRNAYTAAPGDSATAEKIELGKRLFFDPILSGSGKRSCASCHQPDRAFTDGLTKNLDITGKKFVARNTPTLINAALQPAQFDDLRAASLEDQAIDVVQNRDEMHGNMQIATGKLWRDTSYRRCFSRAYPVKNRTAIDTFEVMNALAGYVRSLTALNSRFDAFMRGDAKAMTPSEINGFNLFMGKAKCSTCHYLPLFNGALPPRYMQMEAEVIGVPKYKNSKLIDPDPGTYGIQPLEFNRHAFKTTTLRNAARTAPYMHNGVFKTLEEVVDFYDKGGGAGTGLKVPNQTLAAGRLHLSKKEKQELLLFIKTLNSR